MYTARIARMIVSRAFNGALLSLPTMDKEYYTLFSPLRNKKICCGSGGSRFSAEQKPGVHMPSRGIQERSA